MEQSVLLLTAVVLIAFAGEYFDSTLGMGYGTTLSPLLLLIGFEPMEIVPALLLSEFITGIIAGFTHHSLGNVDFKPKTISIKKIKHDIVQLGFTRGVSLGLTRPLKVVLVLSAGSIAGTVLAVLTAVRVPALVMKLYVGVLVLLIGIVILLRRRRSAKFTWKKIILLGFIASFNKGMSGGGYGPVVTGGQLLAGVDGKNAVAITSFAEGLTCLAGVLLYLLVKEPVQWKLAPFLVLGALLSVPFSVITVKKISLHRLTVLIGVCTLFLGLFTLVKLL